jgi:hypothetical protein
MTALNNDQANISVAPETIDQIGRGKTDLGSRAYSPSRAAWALHEMRRLEKRAIELPIVGKLHAPDAHDVAYVAGLTALLAFGAVELPIALVVLGGHALVKQHHSRYLSTIGEVMEDVWGHRV